MRALLSVIPALFLALFLLAPPSTAPVYGVEPDEVLDDPELEARARELSKEIRCLVCQNESIDSSNAQLAKDLRVIVRERLVAGDSNREVFDYLVARYGDYVLLRPPMRPETYLLWFGPVIALLVGIGAIVIYFTRLRRRVPAAAAPLSPDERKRLDQILAATGSDADEQPGDSRTGPGEGSGPGSART